MKEYIVRYETEQIENSEFFYGGKVECELIRCKNCENHREPVNMCDIWHRHTGSEGYCHRAKKKHQEG